MKPPVVLLRAGVLALAAAATLAGCTTVGSGGPAADGNLLRGVFVREGDELEPALDAIRDAVLAEQKPGAAVRVGIVPASIYKESVTSARALQRDGALRIVNEIPPGATDLDGVVCVAGVSVTAVQP